MCILPTLLEAPVPLVYSQHKTEETFVLQKLKFQITHRPKTWIFYFKLTERSQFQPSSFNQLIDNIKLPLSVGSKFSLQFLLGTLNFLSVGSIQQEFTANCKLQGEIFDFP